MNAWQPKPFLARKSGEQSHVLIGDDLQYAAANDISKMRNKGGDCNVGTPTDREIAKLHFFPFVAKQLHSSSEMRRGPRWEAGLPGVQGDDFPQSGEERSSSPRARRTGKNGTDVLSCLLKSTNHILVFFVFEYLTPSLCFRPS